MQDYRTNWTREDLKVYTLIYCANADYFESHFEVSYIKSKIVNSDYDKLKAEFDADNDYASIQKINHTIEKLGYSQHDKDKLIDEMRELFVADGKFHSLEQNLHRALANIIH